MGETMRSAFQGIWSHKMRSLLTMLGIIIGIAAIICIVSTIKGTNDQIMQNLIGAGNNNVVVSLKQGGEDYYMDSGAPSGVKPVRNAQKKEIASLEGVESATFYHYRAWLDSVKYKDRSLQSASLYGIDQQYVDTTGYEVINGRNLNDSDFSRDVKAALIDDTAATMLFRDEDPIGKIIDIRGEPFVVAGVIAKTASASPVIQSYADYLTYAEDSYGTLFIPYSTWPILFSFDEPQNCIVRTSTVEEMSSVGKQVEDIMNKSVSGYSRTAGMMPADASAETAEGETSEGGSSSIRYKANDLLEKARNQQELANSTNNLLIWIASIALLVGGIGVMNIMLVSVTERTSEIGLKKALGAKKRRILAQFLTESVLLTSIGGFIGVAAGIILAKVISRVSDIPAAISVPAIILGVAFSMAIGIVFGLLPSIKASNLNPIDALRRE